MKQYNQLFLSLVILTGSAIYFVGGDSAMMTLRFQLLAYFTILTLIFHLGIIRSAKGDAAAAGKNFIRYYMAATTFKLLIHLTVILAFSVTHKSIAIPFIISFMVFYAIFTIFEVGMAMKNK